MTNLVEMYHAENGRVPTRDEADYWAVATIRKLRDALRPRDARVEVPEQGYTYHVWHEGDWEPMTAEGAMWWPFELSFDECPHYLPQPPAPEQSE